MGERARKEAGETRQEKRAAVSIKGGTLELRFAEMMQLVLRYGQPMI